MLRARRAARQQAVLCGEGDTIADRLDKDRAAFMDLPAVAFDACDQRFVMWPPWFKTHDGRRVSSQALVRYRNNDYSVPSPARIARSS
jgi:hypothetical protein